MQKTQSNSGSLEFIGSKGAALQNVASGRNLQYKVNFPIQVPLPKLTKILYNGELICTGPAESVEPGYTVTTIMLEHTYKTQVSKFTGQNSQGITYQRPIRIKFQFQPQQEVSTSPPANYAVFSKFIKTTPAQVVSKHLFSDVQNVKPQQTVDTRPPEMYEIFSKFIKPNPAMNKTPNTVAPVVPLKPSTSIER